MRLSDRGLLEIAEREGIVPAPYYDSAGVLTFGIGHTAAAGAPDPSGMPMGMPDDIEGAIDRAIALFRDDIERHEARVNGAIKVPLSQHQFDALVDFDFNTGGIFVATLTKAINAGDPDASRHFFGWLKPASLRRRREIEQAIFDRADYDSNGDKIAVWNVGEDGHLRGRALVMHGRDLLARMGRTAAADAATPSPAAMTLRIGATGDLVGFAQVKLRALGYQVGDVDRQFGRLTRAAVLAFQADHGLDADGVIGSATWAALQAAEPQPAREVTAEVLRERGSRTIRDADTGKAAAVVVGGGVSVGGLLDALPQIRAAMDQAGGLVRSLPDLLGEYWWTGALLAAALIVYMLFGRIQAARVDDARSGANLGR